MVGRFALSTLPWPGASDRVCVPVSAARLRESGDPRPKNCCPLAVLTRNSEAASHDRNSHRNAGHRVRRLGLPRPPCGARAGARGLPHPPRGAPARSRRSTCSRWAASGRSIAVQANLRYPASVEAAVRGADVVINLVGILFERGKQRFEAVQAEGAACVARAAAAAGARMIHVSALGADPDSPALYARTKAAGEAGRARGGAGRDDLPPLDRVRAGGRFLQPLRRDGADVAGAAAGRRRRDQVPAGVRRRRRAGDRQGGRRRARRAARSTSSAGRRCAASRS